MLSFFFFYSIATIDLNINQLYFLWLCSKSDLWSYILFVPHFFFYSDLVLLHLNMQNKYGLLANKQKQMSFSHLPVTTFAISIVHSKTEAAEYV